MKKLVDINESIYKITGEKSEKSQKDALKMFGSVLNLGGIFKRSDVASETALGIQESYRNPASPMAQFMNIQAFRQVNGNVGLHDMQLGMDNMTDPRVVNQSVKNLRAMYHLPENGSLEGVDQGQKWQYLNTLKNWKGIGSYTKASEFDKQYGMGGFKEGQLSKFVDKAPEEILLTASQNFATENEKLSTQLVSGFEQFGKSVQEFANAVTAFVNKFSFGDTPKPAGFSKNLPPVMLRSGGAKDIGDGSSANNYIQTSS